MAIDKDKRSMVLELSIIDPLHANHLGREHSESRLANSDDGLRIGNWICDGFARDVLRSCCSCGLAFLSFGEKRDGRSQEEPDRGKVKQKSTQIVSPRFSPPKAYHRMQG
jgi:hypothetical protein